MIPIAGNAGFVTLVAAAIAGDFAVGNTILSGSAEVVGAEGFGAGLPGISRDDELTEDWRLDDGD